MRDKASIPATLATESPTTQARERLRERILSDRLQAGDRLLAETRLAEALEVSVRSAAQALAAMADEGLVVRQRGRGTFLTPAGVAWAESGCEHADLPVTLGMLLYGKDGGMSMDVLTEVEARAGAVEVLPLASFTSWSHEQELRTLAMMKREGVRTVAFLPQPGEHLMTDYYAHWPQQFGLHFISLIRSTSPEIDAITFDWTAASREVSLRLLAEGCRDVVYVGMDDGIDAKRGAKGVRDARSQDTGDAVYGILQQPSVAGAIVDRVRHSKGRLGVVAKNMTQAIELVAVLRASGLHHPDKVAIASYDLGAVRYLLDFPYYALVPPCDALAELLLSRARDAAHGRVTTVLQATLPFHIVDRQSSKLGAHRELAASPLWQA